MQTDSCLYNLCGPSHIHESYSLGMKLSYKFELLRSESICMVGLSSCLLCFSFAVLLCFLLTINPALVIEYRIFMMKCNYCMLGEAQAIIIIHVDKYVTGS